MSYYTPFSILGALVAFILSFFAWQSPFMEKLVSILFYNGAMCVIVVLLRVFFLKDKPKP